MIPHQTLNRMSRRYGVSKQFAARFLPLIERADRASPDVRLRILRLIERTFQRQAERSARQLNKELQADLTVLDSVARLLHGWEPADWLNTWSEELRGFIQEPFGEPEIDPGDATASSDP